jgi:acyl carrier protein
MEAFVAATWEEMLGVAPIGINDDFFALGGHSLLAIQVAARLRERFEVEVPVQLLFDAPTIAQLAARMQTLVSDRAAGVDRLAEMVQYVGQLSDEEVQRLLAEQGGEPRP